MIIHERKVGRELLYYRALSRRMKLDTATKKSFEIHERGYKGELTYDEVYDETLNHLHVFRGIYLKVNNSIIQCDALIVSDNGFILHEIKNYSGNYTYAEEKWLVRNFQISEDPLMQLKRAMNNLLKIKYNYNLNFSIDGKIIFVPKTIPGDVVEVRDIEDFKSYYRGNIERIITNSSDRIDIECPCYFECGGCQLMGMSYLKQLQYKKDKHPKAIQYIKNLNTNYFVLLSIKTKPYISDPRLHKCETNPHRNDVKSQQYIPQLKISKLILIQSSAHVYSYIAANHH